MVLFRGTEDTRQDSCLQTALKPNRGGGQDAQQEVYRLRGVFGVNSEQSRGKLIPPNKGKLQSSQPRPWGVWQGASNFSGLWTLVC